MTPRPAASAAPSAIIVAGQSFVADLSGALWHEGERTLIVADLHLEKGSARAAGRGALLPPYDSTATLALLAAVIGRYGPRRVVSLGDAFHDGHGPSRLHPTCIAALKALQAGRHWLWIAGNHDPGPPAGLGGDSAASGEIAGIAARHIPSPAATGPELAGHLHPVARVLGRGRSVRRRCFAADGRRCVLPAFGSYAGGLNVLDRAFAGVFDRRGFEAMVLGGERLYRVTWPALLPDRSGPALPQVVVRARRRPESDGVCG